MVVPDRYEINAGNIGRIQGEKNEPAPASAERSKMDLLIYFCPYLFQLKEMIW